MKAEEKKKENNEIRIIKNRINRGCYANKSTLNDLIEVYRQKIKTTEIIIDLLTQRLQCI